MFMSKSMDFQGYPTEDVAEEDQGFITLFYISVTFNSI